MTSREKTPADVTDLLLAWSSGDEAAMDELMPLVYAELRRIARRYMGKEDRHHTLDTSALINEAYLKLVDARGVDWQNRAHFFCGVRASDATHPGGFRPGQTKSQTRGRRATTLSRRGPRGSAGPCR